MLFNSFIFLLFLASILPVFYLIKSKKGKNLFLLIISYLFYGYWDWRFCLLLAFSTCVDYYIGNKLHLAQNPKNRKKLLYLSLISNLGILGFFKYFNFFTESFQSLLAQFNVSLDYLHLNIILPVGISFYTFQTLSYTIDIYRKKLTPTNNFIDFSLFVAFFPQLVAGPIERAKHILPQLSKKLHPSKIQIEKGVILIVTGLFRKVIIGDTAGKYVDHIFGNLEFYKSSEIVCALILFSIQIYADFSGYSHIARGTAKLLGIELMKNFEQPYLSRNITEFWRRWHISLSAWLRDYIYIPLGGNRKGKNRAYMNIMITMLIGGLWHGASWNFVIWGGLHGLYLIIHKIITKNKKINTNKIESLNVKTLIKIISSNALVLFTWIFFRSNSWETTKLFFIKIIYWEESEFTLKFISITIAYISLTLLLDSFEYITEHHAYLSGIKKKEISIGILSALFLVTLIYMAQSNPSPFVYFQF